MSSKNPEKSKVVVKEDREEKDLLSQILDEGRLARNENQVAQAKDLIGEFVSQVMSGQMVVSRDVEASINARVAAIDQLLSAQLNAIMHDPAFQKLEGSDQGIGCALPRAPLAST